MSGLEVAIHTSYGDIIISLDPGRLSYTIDNFVRYVSEGFYNETLIHRVVDNFLIQGGGFEPGLIQKTTRPPIKNESALGLSNKRGTIAMARLPDDPDSATSQFFINTTNNDMLDFNANESSNAGYCAFGQVTDGMEVVDRIEGVGAGTVGEHHNVPLNEIIIANMELLNSQ